MSPSNTYETKSKVEFTRITKDGEVETWYKISATSAGGTNFHVDVRETELDNADAVLTARAKKLDSI